jgi:hypothetical protein
VQSHGFAALRDEAVIRLCSAEGVPGQRLECAGVVDGMPVLHSGRRSFAAANSWNAAIMVKPIRPMR